MRTARLGIVAMIALSICAGAHAQDADQIRLRPKWEALDANKDGNVTLNELHPIQAQSMKLSDHDGNGSISLSEYADFDLDPGGAGRLPLLGNIKLSTDLPYAGTRDPRQSLDLYLPKHRTVAGPLPVIAYVHGGAWMVGSKVMARSQVMPLVESGRYAAVSIGYRLSWQDPWPAQINDVKAAIRWIRANARKYGLDPNRICAIGASAGGHLVAKLGLTNGVAADEGTVGPNLRQSSRVQCVIDEFGPIDVQQPDVGVLGGRASPVSQLLGGAPAEKPDLARNASPILDVDPTDPPFLILHGTKDPLVNYQDSVRLNAALRKAGVPVLFQTVEGGGHGDFGNATAKVEERIRLFLERQFYNRNTQVPTDTLRK